LRYGNRFESCRPEPNSALTEYLLTSRPEIRDSLECYEYFKNNQQALHPSLRDWLQANSLSDALPMEGAARRRNLQSLLQSRLTQTWEPWMKRAIDDGALPGIAPLLRGARRPLLEELAQRLLRTNNLAVTIYHFNWSGDPLAPNYEPCLPLPTHGMAPNMESVLAELARAGGS
jgi:hypothetical protein